MPNKNIDLLSSIPKPKTTWEKLFDWTFSVGRTLVVIVEAIVLIAFVVRFSMDKINNDAYREIIGGTAQLDFYAKQGTLDEVTLNLTKIEGATTLLDEQNNYSLLLKDVTGLLGNNAKLVALSLQSEKVRIDGITQTKAMEEVERKIREFKYLKNVSVDLNTVGEGTGSLIEFRVDATIDPSRYKGKSVIDLTKQQSENTSGTSETTNK